MPAEAESDEEEPAEEAPIKIKDETSPITVVRLPAPRDEGASPRNDTTGVPTLVGPLPAEDLENKVRAEKLLLLSRRLSNIPCQRGKSSAVILHTFCV